MRRAPVSVPEAPGNRAARRARAKRREKRGVALVMVLAALAILTVLLAEFQDDASSEQAAVLSDRDAVRAEYIARSAINLSRLLIATEPTIRTAIGPLMAMMMGGGSAPQIPVWEFSDSVLGAFNDVNGTQAFSALAGVDITRGKNLGMKGGRFEVVIVDEDSKINVNVAARGDAITEQRLGMQLLGLMQGDQYNPMFENRDAEGQFTDRQGTCSALVDWADADENLYTCDPRNSQNSGTSAQEDAFYQILKVPYRRKNAPYDSLDELHLVRGITDDFFATFIDPDPSNPKKRVMTIWGQGTVNVNSANAQTLLAIVCGAAVPETPMCTDPIAGAKFLTAVNLLRGFTAGAPLFGSPSQFVKGMKGSGMFGKVMHDMLGLDPVKFTSDSETQKMISTESKMFSIYADGIVPGYRRQTKIRIHAVVDFRNAPPPGEMWAGINPYGSGSASNGAGLAVPTAAPTATTTSTSGSGAGSLPAGGTSADAISGALAPNPGGSIVYYRIE
jgi:general secretion pathway protein K